MPAACGLGARVCATLVTAGLLISGCSLGPRPYHLAEDASRSSEFRQLSLLPMNVDRTPIPTLAPGAELIGGRIRSHLEAKGFQVVAPPMSKTLEIWKKCVEDVGGLTDESGEKLDPERYARARSELARRMLESYPADGVIASAVVLRPARYSGDKLAWDGVRRPALVDISETNLAMIQLGGQELGISLRTSVFDREGRNIFERYVGLEVLRRYRVKEGRMLVTTRSDLFQDEAIIEQGVTLSFEPWLSGEAK